MKPHEILAQKCAEKIVSWPIGEPEFADPRYLPFNLSLRNFHKFDLPETEKKICFVDGGNLELLNTPGLVIHLTRIGYCLYQGNEKIENPNTSMFIDYYTLASASKQKDEICYSIEIIPRVEDHRKYLPDEEDLFFNSFDRSLMIGNRRVQLTSAAASSRIFGEWKLAESVIQEILEPGDLLVRDGSLQTQVTGESKYSNKAYEQALKKKVTFTGLAKTSTLFTDTGMPLFSAISIMAKRNELGEYRWYYHPIVDIKAPDHRAVMLAVRLHPKSKHVFRFEILKEQAEKMIEYDEIVSQLAYNSTDATFPGYPYGLIEADRIGRVRNEEIEPHRIQLLSTLSGLGAWDELEAFIRAVDAHQIIDEI